MHTQFECITTASRRTSAKSIMFEFNFNLKLYLMFASIASKFEVVPDTSHSHDSTVVQVPVMSIITDSW